MNTEGIIGHAAAIKKLKVMLEKGTVPHTLLFTGTAGIGKKIIARRFLGSFFCRDASPPCGACSICVQMKSNTFPDMIETGPDEKGKIPIGAMDGREEGTIRWLINRLSKKSLSGTYGVIIDGIDAISIEGQNALLKTIEEPQKGTRIILLSSNRSTVLPTILSRSTEISFNPLPDSAVKEFIEKNSVGNSGLISILSGGSLETAGILSDGSSLGAVLRLCDDIRESIEGQKMLNPDITGLQKMVPMDTLCSIMIHLYRYVLLGALNIRTLPDELNAFAATGEEKLRKIIKIFLALRKGLSNNLNFKSQLKAMVYRLGADDTSCPIEAVVSKKYG